MRFQVKNEDRYEELVGLRVATDLAAESISGHQGEEQELYYSEGMEGGVSLQRELGLSAIVGRNISRKYKDRLALYIGEHAVMV